MTDISTLRDDMIEIRSPNNEQSKNNKIDCDMSCNEFYLSLKNKIINSTIIDQLTVKYAVMLDFINKILSNMEMDKICVLTDFKDVNRELLISEKNKEIFDTYLPKIYKYFGKRECQYNQKSHTKHYILTVLKNMCKQLLLDLVPKYKNVQIKGYVTSYVLYSIQSTPINYAL